MKTGAESIRDLVRQVAVLPPLMGVLRGVVAQTSCGFAQALRAPANTFSA
jgi:hypothetical protein